MKANKHIYILMIVVGAILTASFVITIWTNPNIDAIINIVAMVGSGVFCSAIVALFTELRNERILELEHNRQREYILSSLKNSLKFFFVWELKQISSYSILAKTDNKKTNKYELSILDSINKIINYLEQISSSIETIYQYSSVIDSEYLKRIKARNNLAYESVLPYYKNLQSIISSLIIDSNNYLISGVLDEKKINTLKDMQQDINAIIGYSNEDGLELLFEFKLLFFKNLSEYLDAIEINKSERLNCYIREIV
jgi:hypothetical protein